MSSELAIARKLVKEAFQFKRKFVLKSISRNSSSFLLSITSKSALKARFSTPDLAFLELNKQRLRRVIHAASSSIK